MKNLIYRIFATLAFFTRLPLWRLCNIPAEHYRHVVPLWPLVGWLTGGVMALVFLSAQCFLPPTTAALLALGARLLLTGALHEDGFADFFDGFGGGTTRERILAIMKDSHIGTYGVLALLFYVLTMVSVMSELPHRIDLEHNAAAFVVLTISVDTLCKYFASHIVFHLPYARTADQAKNKLVYARVTFAERLIGIVLAVLPLILLFVLVPATLGAVTLLKGIALMALTLHLVSVSLFHFMQKRIQGYTGDCCGATFIICELVSYLVLVAIL